MKSLHFMVEGRAIPNRKEGRAAKLKGSKRSIVQLFDSAACKKWKAHIRETIAATSMGPMLDGPLGIKVIAIFPLAKKKYSKKVEPTREREWKTNKPDASNLLKAVEDACIGLLYADDQQIVDTRCIKFTGKEDEPARIIVHLWEVDELPKVVEE